ncbi:hypothetical protein NUW54_g4764 [Trametes sanguinea]|uniref:Uncharacterized protein n=1 Tax=Trametes sanguinea TaxID=158606 RepID=A0ACC1PY93_9APHY|nr:hypothetical protein NUW54_g4764 [Trametes sanguinea]
MRYIDSPPFETVEDVLECLDQVLEGLVFIHDHDVAHRDCAYKNVMMDASALFPQGFHPDMDYKLPDMSAPAPVLSRSVAPVRYYLIDFGISTRLTPDMPRLVVGRDGLDQEPPELSNTVPYDPFKLDVFLIGNLIRRRIYEKYSNLGILEPLMIRMVDADPAKRPIAAEAHRELKAIRRNMSRIRKYWHLQSRDSNPVAAALRNVYSLMECALCQKSCLWKLPSTPARSDRDTILMAPRNSMVAVHGSGHAREPKGNNAKPVGQARLYALISLEYNAEIRLQNDQVVVEVRFVPTSSLTRTTILPLAWVPDFMTSADSPDELAEDVFAVLSEEEQKWRDRYELLETHGYRLRARLRPGWVPSWKGKPRDALLDSEDWWVPPVSHSLHIFETAVLIWIPMKLRSKVMDATRVSDEALVYMKSIRTDSEELRILTYFSSDELRRDPRNHCVPLLDVFEDSVDADMSIIVMPFLRYINNPSFELVDDVLEMLDQVLEGLVFMHDHGVAHRDCAFKNIMMDASSLFPKGFHPIAQKMLADGVTPATVLSRASAPVHYYFIDFGISTWFTDDSPKLVVGTDGLDREPPELSKTVPYDPFKLDVFLIGNLIRRRLYETYSNISMLEPLMNRMIESDPSKRPTAAEAHREFKAIRRNVRTFRKYWLLQPRDSFLVVQAFRSVYSLFHSIYRSIF